jgi:hypothetical protein
MRAWATEIENLLPALAVGQLRDINADGSGMVFITGTPYYWSDLPADTHGHQARAIEEYRRFSDTLRVLLREVPEDRLSKFSDDTALVLRFISREATSYSTPARALEVAQQALRSQVGLISRVGDHDGLFVPDHLGALNCFVRLEYAVPASITSNEITTVNLTAGEYVRRTVDVLRLLHDDDIGIVYLAGFPAAEDYDEHITFVPPFSEYFPERPNMMYRTPMRRIFDSPSGTPLSQGRLERVGELFDAWGLQKSAISGLPVAMERLRGILDRYAPEEVGRLVDAVTALVPRPRRSDLNACHGSGVVI